MNYKENVKWIGINKADYPITIVECGVERTIPAIDKSKSPQENHVKLHHSCFEAYKELFYVVKAPEVQAEATIQHKAKINEREERLSKKPLRNVEIKKIPKKSKINPILLKKRPTQRGTTRTWFKWTFTNVETKEVFDVKSVKKFCEEQGITFHNNCYKFANTDKVYQGWKIIKEEIEPK